MGKAKKDISTTEHSVRDVVCDACMAFFVILGIITFIWGMCRVTDSAVTWAKATRAPRTIRIEEVFPSARYASGPTVVLHLPADFDCQATWLDIINPSLVPIHAWSCLR